MFRLPNLFHPASTWSACALLVASIGCHTPIAIEESVLARVPLSELSIALASAEAEIGAIRDQAEKRVTFANEEPSPTHYSVVYIHGFSATRVEVAPVAERVAASLEANLFETRIAGHGRHDPDALLEATAEAWIRDTAHALEIAQNLGEKVIAIGTSTGAASLTTLAAHPAYEDSLHALVLLSPNYGVSDPRTAVFRLPFGNALAKAMVGPRLYFPPVNEAHATHWDREYPTIVVGEVAKVARRARHLGRHRVATPTLVLYCPEDLVVEPSRIESVFRHIAAREPSSRIETIHVTHSDNIDKHVIAGDALSPETTEDVIEAILGFLASLEPGR